jgi:hypothetical protein
MEELLKTAKSILGTIAPTLASALGGPLAGMAVKSIADVLGLSNDKPEEVYNEIINANPETLLKLKELETNFKIQMKKLEVDVLSLENNDRDSARNREINTKDNTNKYLAYIVITLYCVIQLGLVFSGIDIPSEMREIIIRAFGTLDAIIGMIFGYYFGSSNGSFMKTKQIHALITNGVNDDGR